VTEAHRCEKLAQSFYAIVAGRDSNPRPLDRESDTLPQHHDATQLTVLISFKGLLTMFLDGHVEEKDFYTDSQVRCERDHSLNSR